MDETLLLAHGRLFSGNPVADRTDWQLAKYILEHWNVQKLGEDLAKEVIFRVVNHILYPNHEVTREIVGRAERLAGELWPQLPDEPHMAEIAFLERQHFERKQERSAETRIH